jgi:hypothetical protein
MISAKYVRCSIYLGLTMAYRKIVAASLILLGMLDQIELVLLNQQLYTAGNGFSLFLVCSYVLHAGDRTRSFVITNASRKHTCYGWVQSGKTFWTG